MAKTVEPTSVLEVARAAGGKLLSHEDSSRHVLVSRVVIDSREVKPGDLFVAFEGTRTNGHRFVGDAWTRGASACLVSQPLAEIKGPLILVESSQAALLRLGSWYRGKISAPVIAITGSSGKSTCKEMTGLLLSQEIPVLKAPESFNNEIGVPLTLLAWNPAHRAVVLEMAMRGKGQIRELCQVARPSLGLITSIGEAHVGLLGSVKKIAEAKGELLGALPENGKAFLNGEDSWTPFLREKTGCPVILYGLKPEHPIRAEEVEETWEGLRFTLHSPRGSKRIHLPLLGRHNLLNFLGATAIALELGISLSSIARGAGAVRPLHGRLEPKQGVRESRILDDSYNANPASLEAALEAVSRLPVPGRRILVLGDMLELGEVGEEEHQKVGARLSAFQFSAIFGLGDLTALAVEEARKQGVKTARHFSDHEALTTSLAEFLKPGDAVLVKGSRRMGMERVAGKLEAL